MRTLPALLLAALALAPATALAGPHVRVSVGVPSVRLVVDPWAPHYRPAPRAGMVWVEGRYDRYGRWSPGHWVPAASRAGYVWVDGYWEGPRYIDGYWRPAYRTGYYWREGYYHNGAYIRGDWVWDNRVSAAHERWEDRREYREDRHERWEDAQERREDRQEVREDRQEVREDRQDRHEDRQERQEDRADRGDRGGDHERADGASSSRSRHHDYE